MKKYIYILQLILFSYSFSLHANISIPFEMVNALIILDVEMEGTQNKFIFDTGASDILVNEKLIKKNINTTIFNTLNGDVKTSTCKLEEIKLSQDYILKDLDAFGIDMQAIELYVGYKIGGILGAKVLKNAFTIDFNKKVITFFNNKMEIPNYKHQLKFMVYNNVPLISLEIENKLFSFILDSGASSHIIDKELVNALPIMYPVKQSNLLTASGTTNEISMTHIDFKLSNLIKINEPCLMMDFGLDITSDELQIAGILSLSSLNLKQVHFNFKDSVILFN